MPATKSLAGALVIIEVSTNTKSGFLGSNRYSEKVPSFVYITERALQGASVEATVGAITTGVFL